VNTLKQMQKLSDDGVDGIITDYPNLAKGLR
jgi:glycerophosphoryl diester phosphodiesterase